MCQFCRELKILDEIMHVSFYVKFYNIVWTFFSFIGSIEIEKKRCYRKQKFEELEFMRKAVGSALRNRTTHNGKGFTKLLNDSMQNSNSF